MSKLLDRIEDEALLLNGELAILAQSVKHDNVFFLNARKWFNFNLLPLTFFLVERITSADCLLFSQIESLVVLMLFFLKSIQLLLHLKHVSNSLLKSVVK